MISKLITKYLKTNRRVNIPSVGAFMVKGDKEREIIFSELLKSDDGVLNTLLRQQGLSDIESAAILDRFVFELRHSTEEAEGVFEIEGVGTLRKESGGRLSFTPAPCVEPQPDAEQRVEPQQLEVVEVDLSEPQRQDGGTSRYTTERIKELYSYPQKFRENEMVVKDLKYTQQQKPLGGYAYVRESAPRRGVDKVLLFGVLAAVVALGAIAYGFYVANIEEVTDFFVKLGLKSVE